ncbi:hypothetical protein TURU_082945 [Turdus rufiventris]|nr:hypothetical protein TURU_082945 [Turdus rufiventris]
MGKMGKYYVTFIRQWIPIIVNKDSLKSPPCFPDRKEAQISLQMKKNEFSGYSEENGLQQSKGRIGTMTMQMAIICFYGGHKSPTDFILDHEMQNNLCVSKLNIDVTIIRLRFKTKVQSENKSREGHGWPSGCRIVCMPLCLCRHQQLNMILRPWAFNRVTIGKNCISSSSTSLTLERAVPSQCFQRHPKLLKQPGTTVKSLMPGGSSPIQSPFQILSAHPAEGTSFIIPSVCCFKLKVVVLWELNALFHTVPVFYKGIVQDLTASKELGEYCEHGKTENFIKSKYIQMRLCKACVAVELIDQYISSWTAVFMTGRPTTYSSLKSEIWPEIMNTMKISS